MSIQVENNLNKSENQEVFEQRAHFVPCNIEEDGPANVSKYFEPYVADNGGGETNLKLVLSCISPSADLSRAA